MAQTHWRILLAIALTLTFAAPSLAALSADELARLGKDLTPLGADYLNAWSADLSYTDFFGAGRYNLINDRDFVSFNVKYSF